MINDILRVLKYIELKKLGEDDYTVSYAIYYGSSKVGMLTISKDYDHVIRKILKFIELFK